MFVVLKPAVRPVVDRMFAPRKAPAVEPVVEMAFPVNASATVGEVEEFYGVHLDPDPDRSVGDLVAERLDGPLCEGAGIEAGDLRLSVRDMTDGRISLIEVQVLRTAEDAEAGS